MLEFIVLILVLIGMALTGFTVLAMLLVSGSLCCLAPWPGMFALIIKLAPWLLLVLVVCWLRQQAQAVEHLPLSLPDLASFLGPLLAVAAFYGRDTVRCAGWQTRKAPVVPQRQLLHQALLERLALLLGAVLGRNASRLPGTSCCHASVRALCRAGLWPCRSGAGTQAPLGIRC